MPLFNFVKYRLEQSILILYELFFFKKQTQSNCLPTPELNKPSE